MSPFNTFPEGQTISLSVQIHLVVTNVSIEAELGSIAQMVLPHLNDGEVKSPLSIQWNFVTEGLRGIDLLDGQ
ncbi:hypothetical protein COOONC_21134 [Cooperia oncophora]